VVGRLPSFPYRGFAAVDAAQSKRLGKTPDPCVIELREMLRAVLGDNFLRLHHFGSRVVGDAAKDSDYDVMCVTRRLLSRQEMNEVLDRRIDLQLAYNVFFDLHFFSADEIQSPPVDCLLFLEQAIGEGVVV
jgi:hypothetical protein